MHIDPSFLKTYPLFETSFREDNLLGTSNITFIGARL